MKYVLPAACVLLLCSYTSMAQTDAAILTRKGERQEKREMKRNNKEVSYQSKQQFMRDFPGTDNPTWKATVHFDEVTFNNNGVITTAYYDAESSLVGTTVVKSFTDLPAKAQENIKRYYKEYTPDTVILFDDNEVNQTDMVLYDTAFQDEDNYFIVLRNEKETDYPEIKYGRR